MKNIKYILGILLVNVLLFSSCQEDDVEVGTLAAPTNIEISFAYLDDTNNDGVIDDTDEETVAPGLGSGSLRFTATANSATAIHFVIQNQTKLAQGGSVLHDFTVLGNNTYDVTAIAFGTGGLSTSKTIQVEVLSLYEPPADLVEMLHANSSRTWRIKNEAARHFGLGPAGGDDPFQFFGANPDDKVGVGMYDDRYTFNVDGTFTHITNGDVFGREVLINELGGAGGGSSDGADILNYGFDDYTEQWSLTAPGGVETISLTGLGFIGYYVGGDHKYKILSRSANEMVIYTLDGNGEFNWGFTVIAD